MTQRQERVAGEIRAILGEALIRGEVKDPRVQGAGLITLTHVSLTGDLRQARIRFIVHGADDARLEECALGLNRAAGHLRHVLGARLSTRSIPKLEFEVDRVFEAEEKVDALLREIGQESPKRS